MLSVSTRAASLAACGSSYMNGRGEEKLQLLVDGYARRGVDDDEAGLEGVGCCESERDTCCGGNWFNCSIGWY